MITGGNATIYVSDMDRAVRFYVDVLGLKLARRYGNHWAEIQAGPSLVLGLHPRSDKGPQPGTSGSISIGLTIDEPIDDLVASLTTQGVRFRGPVVQDANGGLSLAFFGDPDGNDLYLCQLTRAW
jgi:catechol 2,3-dioxygenase-like lactoylglutathione lyase family enzyme